MSRPRARANGIIAAWVGDEVVLYDAVVSHYHTLDSAAAAIWRLADGTRTVAAIAREAGSSDAAVSLVLSDLSELGLLEAAMSPPVDRRTLVKRLAVAGALAPVIASISAPHAGAQTSNPCGLLCEPCGASACCGGLVCAAGVCRNDLSPTACGNIDECGMPGAFCSASAPFCVAGQCIECLSDNDCDDGLDCTADRCDILTGMCSHDPIPDFCEQTQVCKDAVCDPTVGCVEVDRVCASDGIDCTLDICDPSSNQCIHVADHSLCPTADPCQVGVCNSATGCTSTPVICPASGIVCAPFICVSDQGGCVQTPNDALCPPVDGQCREAYCDIDLGCRIRDLCVLGVDCTRGVNCTCTNVAGVYTCVPGGPV